MSTPLDNDLIAAMATPPGQGGIGVIRLSGGDAFAVARQICGESLAPREARFVRFRQADTKEIIDEGLALAFVGPASFTGEDVVELHCHGSPVVLQRLLDEACSLGARLARPGEFSERAFLHGKMDLAQAEAVADLIASTSVSAARAAVRSLQGEFSRIIRDTAERLAQLRVFVEACIDFPDEDVDFIQAGEIKQKVSALRDDLADLRERSQQGRLLNEGLAVALIGAPNAGKSSLLNALSGEDAAIVTDIPGTTRDLLKVDLVMGGVPLRLVDTAGLRDSEDAVEKIGVARALEQARSADLVLVVKDASEIVGGEVAADLDDLLRDIETMPGQAILVINKQDLLQERPAIGVVDFPVCWVSALQGTGLAELRDQVLACAGARPAEAQFTARARHVASMDQALGCLDTALANLAEVQPTELVAEELWSAHNALGEIVGSVTPDDLLGRIFSEFCIGK